MEAVLSPEYNTLTAPTPAPSSYARKLKANLAYERAERLGPVPTPPRPKRNVQVSYTEAVTGKKKRTSLPTRNDKNNLDQRLNQLHIATTNHTKSAVETMEMKMDRLLH